MQIHLQTRGLTLSPQQEEYVNQKTEKLVRFAHRVKDDASRIEVEIDYHETKSAHDRIECLTTMFLPHGTLRAEAHGSTVEESIDIVEQKLRVQLEKYKSS